MGDPLPIVNARRIIQALRKAGFVVDRVAGSHYLMVHPANIGRRVTVPFHASRDLKPGTIRSIIRQAGLSVAEFIALL